MKVLEGKLSQKDAQDLKEILRMERENGNRYAVVPTEKDPISKEDFSYYRSAFEAWKHIGQKPVEQGKHLFHSLILLQDEVDHILGITHAWSQKQEQQEKPSLKRRMSR